jgi:hypothetical protein
VAIYCADIYYRERKGLYYITFTLWEIQEWFQQANTFNLCTIKLIPSTCVPFYQVTILLIRRKLLAIELQHFDNILISMFYDFRETRPRESQGRPRWQWSANTQDNTVTFPRNNWEHIRPDIRYTHTYMHIHAHTYTHTLTHTHTHTHTYTHTHTHMHTHAHTCTHTHTHTHPQGQRLSLSLCSPKRSYEEAGKDGSTDDAKKIVCQEGRVGIQCVKNLQGFYRVYYMWIKCLKKS